ncbi:MAG: hypothetical protein H7282_01665 [Cytophagaceae bacterium]|nr:hypothetical protein [Cytophagaceae bacterium]
MNQVLRFFNKGFTGPALLLLCMVLVSFTYKINSATQEVEDYYVYGDSWVHGIPTGFMGEKDGKSIALNDAWKESPYKGEKCIKMTVSHGIEGWRGLHIQFKGTWNVGLDEKTVLPDLSEYDQLEFYAKAIPGANQDAYLIQEIGVGQLDKVEGAMFTDTFVEIGEDWKKHTIKLKRGELKRVNTMLFFTLPEGTLFLDEIKFTKKKK